MAAAGNITVDMAPHLKCVTINVSAKFPPGYRFRLWTTIALLKLAALVSPVTVQADLKEGAKAS